VFNLYDTYGFPADLTADVARERGLKLDWDGFEAAMQVQRDRARAASQFAHSCSALGELPGATEFTGYTEDLSSAQVVALYADQQPVECLTAGQAGQVVLDRTPCYAESGGQVGDTGEIRAAGCLFEVQDTQKHGGHHVHRGVLRQGELRLGMSVSAAIDPVRRAATRLNHSATHLLHAALRQILGTHVTQKGSRVAPDRLRFDFAHFAPVSAEQLAAIEILVNAQIRANAEAETRQMALQDAMSSGAIALFGEKYSAEVRVLRLGDFSTELCGGTHVRRAGDIGLCKIISESGVAAGVRRIEAVTGAGAIAELLEREQQLMRLSGLVKTSPVELETRVEQLVQHSRQLDKEITQLKGKLAAQQGSVLAQQAQEVAGLKVLAVEIADADPKLLLTLMDQLKDKLRTAVIVLAAVQEGKVSLAVGVTKAESAKLKAGELVSFVAQQVGGKGGGRPDLAQAGGNQPEHLAQALAAVPAWVQARYS
jgi:alanyl-tRNA synthetase